ncbi:hypothetical protein SAMN06272775_6067 [Streptomyces sp. 2323.1]|nr:hypothetical protein SAMN06272775_6067 [Streptomyces sp. 2323.1]
MQSLRKPRPTVFEPLNVASLQRGRSGTLSSSRAGRLPRLFRLRAAPKLMPTWEATSV